MLQLIAEAGATHTGLESAKTLVNHACGAGFDAVKFQVVNPDTFAGQDQMFSYEDSRGPQSEHLRTILRRRRLNHFDWSELKDYANTIGIELFCTVTDDYGLALVQEMGCKTIKICSADIKRLGMIRKVAATGCCVHIDTGSATYDDIDDAVAVIRHEGNKDIVIHHCPGGYPAKAAELNLHVIESLNLHYPTCGIGYSDHSMNFYPSTMAIALGATVIEETITLDRYQKGPEHWMSLEPGTMGMFVTQMREAYTSLGSSNLKGPEGRYQRGSDE